MNMQYLQEEYMFEEFILKTTSQNISYNTMFYYINNLLTSFFIIFSSLFTGLFVGFGLVTFMYNPEWKTKTAASSLLEDSDSDSDSATDDDDEDDSDSDSDSVEDYETIYLEEFRSLSSRDLSSEELKALRLKNVREHITDEYDESIKREVIMTYNSDSESFWYYTDHSTKISYTMLNTLARLFAITYDCKKIYLGAENDEEPKHDEKLENVESKQDESKPDTQHEADINLVQEETVMLVKSIFAKFKSYNKEPIVKKGLTTISKPTEKITQPTLNNDIRNQFKYKGKIIEYISFNINNNDENNNYEIKKDNDIENTKKMDYASFKQQFILNSTTNTNTNTNTNNN